MKISKGLWMSAALLSLTACGQAIEGSEAGSNPMGADATTDATDASDADAAASAHADGANSDADSSADAVSSESDGAISAQPDASALDTGVAPLACSSGTADCNMNDADGCETNLGTVSNCGACNNACPSGAHSTAMCSSGACRIACESGFGDCDGDPRNGCEVDLNRSAEHCGRCANRCGGGANASPVCAGGLCGLSCNAGFADCDASLANGCEADLNNSVNHCRACGNVCSAPAGASATCSAGACDFRCNPGLIRCGAQCVRPDDPAFGCGTCTMCPNAPNATSMTCGASGCVPATCRAGYKLCGSACVAIDDPAFGCTASSCGMCALSSGAQSMMCLSGACAVATCAAGHKLCGNACVATNLPQYGCASGSCLSCNPQNAAAVCNGAGSCDYTTCNAGWRDLDGNRSNGCETPAPSQIPGLRVWLSAREAGSLVVSNCLGDTTQQCVTRWNNLVDASNPATPTGSSPLAWQPTASGSATSVLINGNFAYTRAGVTYSGGFGPGGNRQFDIGLGAIVNSNYTVYIVDNPGHYSESYPLACRPNSIFDTNGAFHLGASSATALRLGHYNNDLNFATNHGGPRILIGMQSSTGRTLTRINSMGTVSVGDGNTGLVNRAGGCTIGRGLDDVNKYSGEVYEVLVFNRALTLAEQNSVRTYLNRRYAL
ncbi:MAG: hypothetical protein U0269_16060 [Polyangiales bacterium]